MIFPAIINSQNTYVFDTFAFLLLPNEKSSASAATPVYNYFQVNGDNLAADTDEFSGNTINSLKIVDGYTEDTEVSTPITMKATQAENFTLSTNIDGNKIILAANFANNLNAGTLVTGSNDIDYLAIQRLGPEDGYNQFIEIADIKDYNSLSEEDKKNAGTRDYLINSETVYFYNVQAVAIDGNAAQIKSVKSAMNRYEDNWILCDNDIRIDVMNSTISSITYNNKNGIIEPIGNQYPLVNRFADLSYRSFQLQGIIAGQTDIDGSLYNAFVNDTKIDSNMAGSFGMLKQYKDQLRRNISGLKNLDDSDITGDYLINGMYSELYRERLLREYAMNILTDGKPKLFKSPTEGLMVVKITDVSLSPKKEMGRYISDFSCKITEIGAVTQDILDDFKITTHIEA